MKVVYIAGPYRAGHGRTVRENLRNAEKVALIYWKLGYAVICPHLNTAFFDGEAPDELWLAGDLEIIHRVDVVVVMQNWQESRGAVAEERLARHLGKEIIYDQTPLQSHVAKTSA